MNFLGWKSNEKPHVATAVASGTTLTGDLLVGGNLFIDGALEGNIVASGDVHLGPSGRLKGTISASHVFVSGSVWGNIRCDSLEVTESGEVYGTVASDQKVIRPGGRLVGDSLTKADLSAAELGCPDADVFVDTPRPDRPATAAPGPLGEAATSMATRRGDRAGQGHHDAPAAGAQAVVGPGASEHDQRSSGNNMEQILHGSKDNEDRYGPVSDSTGEMGDKDTEGTGEPLSAFDISPRYR